MWEQVKQALVESAREVCGSVRGGGRNPKSEWWKYEAKAAFKRKEASWKEMMESKERCMEAYREEKRKVKRCIY